MKGQTLIEVVVALAMIVIVLTAVSFIVVSSLSSATFSRNHSVATQFAQEGMEIVRNVRNGNYTQFTSLNGIYCLGKNSTTFTLSGGCSTPNVDIFVREVDITPNACGAGVAQITTKVSWADGKCAAGIYCHTVTLISCLSNYNVVGAP